MCLYSFIYLLPVSCTEPLCDLLHLVHWQAVSAPQTGDGPCTHYTCMHTGSRDHACTQGAGATHAHREQGPRMHTGSRDHACTQGAGATHVISPTCYGFASCSQVTS